MPKPAFPHEKQAGAGFDGDEGAQFLRRILAAKRCGHHHREARVLEADRAASLGRFNIKAARQDRVRVNVGRVMPAGLQQIDPQAVEFWLSGKVEGQLVSKAGRMAGQELSKVREGWVALGE